MGHSDKPGDGCHGGGRSKCGGNLLVGPEFGDRAQRPERENLLRAIRNLRRLMRQSNDVTTGSR